MFGNIQITKNKFYPHKIPVPLRDVAIEKVLESKKIYLVKKTINTSLVTCWSKT